MQSNLPVILLKNLILLPHQEVRLELNNEISKRTVEMSSKKYDGELLVVCPLSQIEEQPDVSDLPSIGVIGKLKSKISLPNGNLRIVITGITRVYIEEYLNHKDDSEILKAIISNVRIDNKDEIKETALFRKLTDILNKYILKSPYISNSVLSTIKGIKSLDVLTDVIASFIPFDIEKKQDYMMDIDYISRAEKLIHDLTIELEVVSMEEKLDSALKTELDNSQKEFILKEKIKQIKKELGNESGKDEEVEIYKKKLESLNINEKTKIKIFHEIEKYSYTGESSPDSGMIRNYLDWVLNLPWGIYTKDNNDLNKIKLSLDKTHFGLDKIKERIIEYIAIKERNSDLKSPIICLVGPPGVGKTTFAMAIAKSLNKEFYKISVGGLNDSAELVGHRRTYLGANPGRIIQGIKKCNSSNSLILIDEVDKMVKDFKGDPASTLLDIVDPEQNMMFVDNYIEEPYDLSKVLFILTANDETKIPVELLDRLEIINLSSYTEFEKIDIASKYLLPKIYKEHLITKEIKINKDVISELIESYTKEAGVRELERCLSTIVRKITTNFIKENRTTNIVVQKNDLTKYLSLPKYDKYFNITSSIGVCNGLAYTPFGGLVMPLESSIYKGKEDIILTGSLGNVMQESIKVAISYIKSNCKNLEVDINIFNKKDIHFHALEGAINKEGPSAGIAIVTTLLSLLKDIKIDNKIAMTGEISLKGNIIKIGGLKEKLIGAYNAGIKKVFIPYNNTEDLENISEKIKNNIEIIPVKNYEEIYKELFIVNN